MRGVCDKPAKFRPDNRESRRNWNSIGRWWRGVRNITEMGEAGARMGEAGARRAGYNLHTHRQQHRKPYKAAQIHGWFKPL